MVRFSDAPQVIQLVHADGSGELATTGGYVQSNVYYQPTTSREQQQQQLPAIRQALGMEQAAYRTSTPTGAVHIDQTVRVIFHALETFYHKLTLQNVS